MATVGAKKDKTSIFGGLRCPHCGDIDTLAIEVESLEVACRECGEPVTHAQTRDMVRKWIGLFNRIDSATREDRAP